jgi:putative ABC transport system substrate-binding protein
MKRREFITLLGSTAATWPLMARAQPSKMPVIGLLDPRSPDGPGDLLDAFRQGLKETGHVEGESVTIEYRWANNQSDRLPALAADLVRRRVALIVADASTAAVAAKAATSTVPVVFLTAEDPVQLGLVASLARPGGNLTGVNFLANELSAKRLELLLRMTPGATRVAVLVNSDTVAPTVKDVEAAAQAMSVQIRVLNAKNSREIDAAFETFASERPDALFVASGAVFNSRRVQLAQWATYHRIPATYSGRLYVEAGGLMSYGASITDAYRQMGVYAGRILAGSKPANIPVVQSSKFDLVINAQTARILHLTIPPTLLAITDEVIE